MLDILFWLLIIGFLLYFATNAKSTKLTIALSLAAGFLITNQLIPAITAYTKHNSGEYTQTIDGIIYSCKNLPKYGRVCYDNKGIGLADSEGAFNYLMGR